MTPGTARADTPLTLRDHDALWHAVNQHSIVSMSDLAGNITFVNDTFVRISGYSREELLGQNHRILKSDVQSAAFWDSVWKMISSGYAWKGVVCNRARNGSRYWVEAQISPFFDAHGNVEKYFSIRTDITAHRRALDELELARSLQAATEALQLRKFHLRATLDNLPFQFWLKDLQGRYLAANQVLAHASGFQSADDVTGLTDHDLWPTALALKYRDIDAEVIHSRLANTREEQAGANGAGPWLEVFIKPLIAGNGELVGTVGYSYDISARKQAQEQLREHTEQLDSIFDLSPDGFVSFDAARCVSHVSPAFCRMSGIALTQLIGLDESAFSDLLALRCAKDSRSQGFDGLRHGASIAPPGGRYRIELSVGCKRVLDVSLRISDSRSVSQILYFRDVTQEIEVDRLKGDFLTTAAHELRTPMVSVYGFLEVLTTQELDAQSRHEFLGVAFRQSELMVSILNELLDLARLEERRNHDFVLEPVRVQTAVHAVASGLKLPPHRAQPLLNLADAPLFILADSRKVQQAIGNVVCNAYKYSPEGGTVQIDLLESEPEAGAVPLVGIRVTDRGIGMTPEQVGRVFERFYRADASGKSSGAGLGMSIVHEIVQLHGGRVDLSSQPAAGTSVTLWFPEAQGRSALL